MEQSTDPPAAAGLPGTGARGGGLDVPLCAWSGQSPGETEARGLPGGVKKVGGQGREGLHAGP